MAGGSGVGTVGGGDCRSCCEGHIDGIGVEGGGGGVRWVGLGWGGGMGREGVQL